MTVVCVRACIQTGLSNPVTNIENFTNDPSNTIASPYIPMNYFNCQLRKARFIDTYIDQQ